MFTTSMSGAWASLNFFKVWKSWGGQRLKEIERLRALFEQEGREKISVSVAKANKERGQSPTFSETKKVEIKPTSSVAEPEFNIEEIYEGAMERTVEAEPQMRDSAVEYIHPFTPNNI